MATDRSISCEARLLYVVLCLMAWSRGYCWPSLATLGSYLGRSDDSVAAYHKELQAHGLLVVKRTNQRRSNRYYPATLHGQSRKPQSGSGSHHERTRMRSASNQPTTRTRSGITPKKLEIENVFNVSAPQTPEPAPNTDPAQNTEPGANGNVVFASFEEQNQQPTTDRVCPLVGGPNPNNTPEQLSQSQSEEKLSPVASEAQPHRETEPKPKPQPAPAPFDLSLVLEIENVTGDRRSRGAWVQIVRHAHPETVQVALSSTRCKAHEESGVNLGAYFIGVVKNHEPDFCFRKKGQQKLLVTQTTEANNQHPPAPPVLPAQAKPDPAPVDSEFDNTPEAQERRWATGVRMFELLRKRLAGEISQEELEALVEREGEEAQT